MPSTPAPPWADIFRPNGLSTGSKSVTFAKPSVFNTPLAYGRGSLVRPTAAPMKTCHPKIQFPTQSSQSYNFRAAMYGRSRYICR